MRAPPLYRTLLGAGLLRAGFLRGVLLAGALCAAPLAGAEALAQVPPQTAPRPDPAPPAPTTGESQIQATLTVKVPKRDVAMDALIAETRRLGGYFANLSAQQVVLRVPVQRADALIAYAGSLGLVVARGYQRNDLSATLGDSRSRLKSRADVLQRYFDVLNTAHVDAVVSVEQQITSLIAEIESLEGQIRALESQAELATVTVNFQFRERAAPRRDGSSSFGWLNTVNLADLIDGFRGGARGEKLGGVTVPVPDGFARYDNKSRPFRAVSPDGVLFQVRAAEHKPEATLDFWREALKKRMADAGYTFIADAEVSAGGVKGYLIELAAPMGTEDSSYWVAVFPDGARLILVEAAGEAGLFQARSAAIRAAIGGMKI